MTIEVEPAAGEDVPSFPPLPIPGCRFCFGRMEGGLAHLTHYHMAMNPVVTQLVTGHLGHLVTALSALSPSFSLLWSLN